MILVDTSIWIDHLHRSDSLLSSLLTTPGCAQIPSHDHGGALPRVDERSPDIPRAAFRSPSAALASHAEVLRLVELQELYGQGLSPVDAHLLAALRLSAPDRVWTRDRASGRAWPARNG